MAEDLIRYDILVQEALRGIVRKVLNEVTRAGLPGDHHFYISFETCAPGVQVSNRVRSKYPKEMTIVLQHQFWDLVVTENAFDIGLSFGGVPEHLHIPFKAVKGFFDPHVQFNLQFEPYRADEKQLEKSESETELEAAIGDNANIAEDTEETVANLEKVLNEADNEDSETGAEAPEGDKKDAPDPESDEPSGGADVVSLDAFRKKP